MNRIFFIISSGFFSALLWINLILAPLQQFNTIVLSYRIPFLIAAVFFLVLHAYFNPRNTHDFSGRTILFFLILAALSLLFPAPAGYLAASFFLASSAAYSDKPKIYSLFYSLLIIFSGLFCVWSGIYMIDAAQLNITSLTAAFCSYILNAAGFTVFRNESMLMINGTLFLCDTIKTGLLFFTISSFPILAILFFEQIPLKKSLKAVFVILFSVLFSSVFYTLFLCRNFPDSLHASQNIIHFLYVNIIPFWLLLLPFFYTAFRKISFSLPKPLKFSKKSIYCAAAFFFAGMMLSEEPPNFKKIRTILIDETHSAWEPTHIAFDMNITGTYAENSYYSFMNYLSKFTDVKIIGEFSTPLPMGAEYLHCSLTESLKKYPDSILILKCPTRQYSNKEISSVLNFTQAGGSLFMIGDHTNVMFMNTYLNQISEYAGITYNTDSVYTAAGGWITLGRNEMPLHAVNSKVNTFVWATNCSLNLYKNAKAIMFAPLASFSDTMSYNNSYFFGSRKIEPAERFGFAPVTAVSEIGRGKIVAFTDSTCFNNYLMFTPARREFIAGILSYLSSESSAWYFPVSLLLFIVFSLMAGREHVCSSDIITGFCMGIPLWIAFNSVLIPSSVKITPIRPLPPQILIDAFNTPFHTPSYASSERFLSAASYDTIVFDIPRSGFFPEINTSSFSREELNKYFCFLTGPGKRMYNDQEKNILMNYVKNGGTLLILSGYYPVSNSSENLLQYFKFTQSALKTSGNAFMNPCAIHGGQTLWEIEGNPVISFRKIGSGIVLCIGDDYLFTKISAAYYVNNYKKLISDILHALYNKNETELIAIPWQKYFSYPADKTPFIEQMNQSKSDCR